MPPTERDAYRRLSRSGIDDLRGLVATHEIECDWDDTGWMLAAVGDKGIHDLAEMEEVDRELDYTIEPLDRDGMERVTGATLYRRGLRFPGYPLVNAAALVRGLAETVPDEIEIYENSPVTVMSTRTAVDGFVRIRIWMDGEGLELACVFHGGRKHAV